MRTLRRILLAICAIAIVYFGIFLFFYTFKNYVRNYYAAINLPRTRSFSTIVEKYGEPISIVLLRESGSPFAAQYNGIELIFSKSRDGSNASFDAVNISSSDYRFGRRKIGIGSTRDEVLSAYNGRLHSMAKWLEHVIFNDGRPIINGLLSDHAEGSFTIIDGIYWITFRFDEDDIVNQISIHEDGP